MPSQSELMCQFTLLVEQAVNRRHSMEGEGLAHMPELMAPFDQGLDVNATDSQGKTPLGVVASLTRGSFVLMCQLARELVMRGANPMIKDEPLGRTISHRSSSFLLMEVIEALVKREREAAGLRDQFGGGVLHYLATVRPDIVSELLEEDDFATPPHGPLLTQEIVLGLRQQDQSSVLHILWDPECMKVCPDVKGQAMHRWRATKYLVNLGLDPLGCNGNGGCPAQWMTQAISQGHPVPEDDIWERIRSQLSQQDLATQTPPVTLRNTMKSRL